MLEYRLKTPLNENVIRSLNIGDIVYLSGIIVTARDAAHSRALSILNSGGKLPIDLNGLAIYHCGPVVDKKGDEWIMVAAGPTTSARMDALEYDFIEKTGIRMVIGKGGMGSRTVEACRKFGAVYTIFTGGAAVLAVKGMKKVLGVHWLDLGIPEALWVIEVEDFGPLMVVIDSHGNNFYDSINNEVYRRLKEEIYPKIGVK
ncbi:MAG: FumA C-terminus/TtdB family hydratase beta subunit [Candidatus Methanomethylicia archaeon]|nr:FumA C-terminus/TtdB family hydratase beta subunit [Candidatus Methanomethylicia archaeon]MCX8168833.1 FumA C-terminus/TtdB family hydratase beta subunit [Candidatus Methanomethylicia archaeon]